MLHFDMLRYLLLFCIYGVFFAASLNIVIPGPQYPPTKGEVWPKPQRQVKDDKYYIFDPAVFTVKVPYEKCDFLTNAVERHQFLVRDLHRMTRRFAKRSIGRQCRSSDDTIGNDERYQGTVQELHVALTAPCESLPYFGMDESYNLTVGAVARLTSASIWGVMRGLETWSQLFYFTSDYRELRINATDIHDYPRYAHRGLLLDTSRHYLSLLKILKNIDAMAANKMNVLHWHIVDDQSFPYQSERFPDLSRLGAYHPNLVYTKHDIEIVVKHAAERGVRVLPEFDVPGHTSSWGVAFPSILTKCYNGEDYVGLGPMDPTNNVTYKLLQDLFREVQEWFPDKYIHVGGDEVDLSCWESNPDLIEYMRQHNMTSAAKLHALFMENVIPLLGEKSTPIVWQEVFDERVPLSNDTLIQVWKPHEIHEMLSILANGHKVIYSSAWYLDHLRSGGDWTDSYLSDPRQMVRQYSSTVNVDNIVGGEACMWGEVVNDMNVLSRVWPRASAVAERLWSPETEDLRYMYSIPDEVYSRLEEHTCRMNRRGIDAQPPSGPGFCLRLPNNY